MTNSLDFTTRAMAACFALALSFVAFATAIVPASPAGILA